MTNELELLLNFDKATPEIIAAVDKAKIAFNELQKTEAQLKAWADGKEKLEKEFNEAKRDLIRAMKTWDPSGLRLAKPEEKPVK